MEETGPKKIIYFLLYLKYVNDKVSKPYIILPFFFL